MMNRYGFIGPSHNSHYELRNLEPIWLSHCIGIDTTSTHQKYAVIAWCHSRRGLLWGVTATSQERQSC